MAEEPGLHPDRHPDPHNAFVEQAAIAGVPDGPLAGLTFAVKDNIAVKDQMFTVGHPLFADRRASDSARAVTALFAAGADFVGMAQTDAGGFGASTLQTKNPAAPDLIVGGSSGGSAAAVAAGHCDFALGTDTGGSVRIPAACTGLYGFKPTNGRVSNDGVFPLTPQLDHVGVIASSLDILERSARVLLDADAQNENATKTGPGTTPDRLRIAVEIDRASLFDQAISDELDRAAEVLSDAGHEVVRLAVPGRENIADAHGVIVLSEASAIYADLTEDQRNNLGKAAASALRHAKNLHAEEITAAWEWARAADGRLQKGFENHDVIISPTLPIAPPAADARRIQLGGGEHPVVVGMTLLTCLANLTGNPVIGLPNPLSRALPRTGLQLLGPMKHDEVLFGISARIEADLAGATAP
jgi:Asp-tRNA(Asn)/Glu-tRNA(Gln) amidotransferase A subunit family amidase